MHKPVRIDFIAMDGTPELRGAIERHLAKLLERQGPARGCHVAIKAPAAHQRAGRYEVSIRLVLAEGSEIVVGPPPRDDARNADLAFAIDDAFRRARRRLQDQARRLREGAGKRKTAPERGACPAPAGSAEASLVARGERIREATNERPPVARKTASAPAGKSAGKRRSTPQAEPKPAPSPPRSDAPPRPAQPVAAIAAEPAVPLAAAGSDAAAAPPAMLVDVAPPQVAPPLAEAAGQALPGPVSAESSLVEPAAAEAPPELVREATVVEPARAEPPGAVAAVADLSPVEPAGPEPALIEPASRAPNAGADAEATAVPAVTKPAPSPVADTEPTLADLDTLSRSFAAAAVAKSIERLEPSISASITNIAPLSFAMALTFMKTAAVFNAASTSWMNSYFACLGSMMQPPPAAAKAKDAES